MIDPLTVCDLCDREINVQRPNLNWLPYIKGYFCLYSASTEYGVRSTPDTLSSGFRIRWDTPCGLGCISWRNYGVLTLMFCFVFSVGNWIISTPSSQNGSLGSVHLRILMVIMEHTLGWFVIYLCAMYSVL